jgi:hypothetical protein
VDRYHATGRIWITINTAFSAKSCAIHIHRICTFWFDASISLCVQFIPTISLVLFANRICIFSYWFSKVDGHLTLGFTLVEIFTIGAITATLAYIIGLLLHHYLVR